MSTNHKKPWRLAARVLWWVAIAIDAVVATAGFAIGSQHIRNDELRLTMAMFVLIATAFLALSLLLPLVANFAVSRKQEHRESQGSSMQEE